MMKLSALVFLAVLPFFAAAQPEICFETTKINFGLIEYGSNGTFVFKFTNSGNKPLILTNGQSSCGCLVCYWPKDPIMPGQRAEIHLKYDTRRAGPTIKTATISCNDPEAPQTVLTIKGAVRSQPKAFFVDSTFDFGAVSKTQKLAFEVRNFGSDSLKIVKIEQVSGKLAELVPAAWALAPDLGSPVMYDQIRIVPSTKLEFSLENEEQGKFTKQWKVYLNDGREPVLLTASGKVL